MAVSRIGDTLLLEKGEAFKIAYIVLYDEEEYLYAVEVPKDVVEMVSHESKRTVFLKETIDKDTNELFVQKVEDKKLLKNLTNELLFDLGIKVE